jgi:Cu/Ag efflux protein CusF
MSTPVRIVACAALTLAVSCRDGAAPERPAARAEARRYTVRGEVVRVSPPGAAAAELSIRHEAIPDFADRTGAVVGMAAMVMPFPVAPGVSLAGVEPGDKVRFRFAMDWEQNRMQIEAVEELPRDTALQFR